MSGAFGDGAAGPGLRLGGGRSTHEIPRGLHPAANQEYYQQWSLEEGEPCAMDMSTYTLEELEHITSEYTLRNQVSRSRTSLTWAPPTPHVHGS